MVFLIKCMLCIALVIVALRVRDADAPAPPAESQAHAVAPKPPRRPQIDETARDLLQAGTDAVMSAARDRCLSAPRECAAALQRLQAVARDR